MEKHEAEKLIETIKSFIEDAPPDTLSVDDGRKVIERMARERLKPGADNRVDESDPRPWPENGSIGQMTPSELEKLYQMFKARFIDDAKFDPILLQLIMVQPEIIIGYERKVEQIDGATLKGRVARLIATGWIGTTPRATSAIRKELARTGSDPGGGGTLADQLSALQRGGFLHREADGWTAAPGIKISEREITTQ